MENAEAAPPTSADNNKGRAKRKHRNPDADVTQLIPSNDSPDPSEQEEVKHQHSTVVGPLSDIYFLNPKQTKFVCVGFSPVSPHQLVVTIAKCGQRNAVVLGSAQWQNLVDIKAIIQHRFQTGQGPLQSCQLGNGILFVIKNVFGKLKIVLKDLQGVAVTRNHQEWIVLDSLQRIITDILYHKKKEETDVQNQIMAYRKYMLHHHASGVPSSPNTYAALISELS